MYLRHLISSSPNAQCPWKSSSWQETCAPTVDIVEQDQGAVFTHSPTPFVLIHTPVFSSHMTLCFLSMLVSITRHSSLYYVFSGPAISTLRYLYESRPCLRPIFCVFSNSSSTFLFWSFLLLKITALISMLPIPLTCFIFHLSIITSPTM